MKKTLAILLALAQAAAGFAALAEGEATPGKAEIEAALNLANNPDQEWTYSADADAWTLSVVTAVTKPVIESEEGVSVCVPGAYVTGIDTDGDGAADVTADTAAEAVKGSLVIDYEAEVTGANGVTYTADTSFTESLTNGVGKAGAHEEQRFARLYLKAHLRYFNKGTKLHLLPSIKKHETSTSAHLQTRL